MVENREQDGKERSVTWMELTGIDRQQNELGREGWIQPLSYSGLVMAAKDNGGDDGRIPLLSAYVFGIREMNLTSI